MVYRTQAAPAGGRNLSEEVYHRLRREISQGVLRPNEALVEADVAHRLRVSRTPVRESMQRLASDGLIVSRRRRWFVYEHSRDEVIELYEVRGALEGYAARLAAVRATDEQLATIASYQDCLTGVALESPARLAIGTRFHDHVIAAANNATLSATIHRNRILHFSRRVAEFSTDQDLAVSTGQHAELMAALAGRDPDRAETIAREHVEHALSLILRRLF